MIAFRVLAIACFVISSLLVAGVQAARLSEPETVRRASAVLDQIMAAPASGIPLQLLSDAQAIVIVPQMKSGAFVVGIRKGRGVLVIREGNGAWRAPQFVEMTGGSLGWQAGVQSSDVILVFRSRKGLDNLLQGKFTIGADASVAAGPVGRRVAAATDLDLSAEIYSYSRSRGAFVGVAIDGTVLKSDAHASVLYYGHSGSVPPEAARLIGQLAAYSGAAAATETSHTLPAVPSSTLIANRQQLIEASQQLSAILEPAWREHLALPQEIYQAEPNESNLFGGLHACLQRYENVAAQPQYAALATRPEFQLVLNSLRQSVSQPSADSVTLPAPPAEAWQSGPRFPQ